MLKIKLPTINLPGDKTRRRRLQDKLRECMVWRLQHQNQEPYSNPTTWVVCAISILEDLFAMGHANSENISFSLFKEWGAPENFFEKTFNNCWGVIAEYCKTGGGPWGPRQKQKGGSKRKNEH